MILQTFRDLKAATLSELEAWYGSDGQVAVPRGVFRGRHLLWLDTPAARHPLLRPLEELVFARLPWRIDFERRLWFWLDLPLGVGHFSPSVGPSRWRDANAVRLLYDDRRLPGFMNLFLYDEVKPLTQDLCLGLGGISAGRGRGEQFFFALTRD